MASSAAVAAAAEPALVPLQFDQPLKGCSNAELQKRLRALHEELSDMDQDVVDTSSIDSVARALIQHSLLLNKEKGVKAYLACCLADVLRLYAPDAPYSKAEIKDIFEFFCRQLKNLGTATAPHYSEYFYLIESLSNVKSICLVAELEGGEDLMRDFFVQSFDVISSDSPKNVEICLADLLMQLVEESPTLTPEVVDTLLAQFLPSAVKKRPAAHRLAIDVCTGSSDKLQRYVCQYFAEQITSTIEGAKGGDDEDEDEDMASEDGGRGKKAKRSGKGKKAAAAGDTSELPSAFITAHNLIRQINRSVPSLLTNVIPQLEEELATENAAYRRLATEVLGLMFGEKPGQGDLAHRHPSTWKLWLGRSRDKTPAVRMALVSSLKGIWTQHPELANDISLTMHRIMVDTDDKVRLAACQIFTELDYETTSHHVAQQTLVLLSERCRDRKDTVRDAAFKSLGKLYNLAYTDIEGKDEHAVAHFGWIPGSILESIKFVGDAKMTNSIRYAITSTLLTDILPLPKKEEDAALWVDRFLLVMNSLDADQRNTLLTLTHLGIVRPSAFDAFIMACEQHNGGVIDSDADAIKERLKATIRAIAGTSPEPTKTTEDLMRFANANEKQLYKLLKTLLDSQLDLKTLLKNYKEVLRRVKELRSGLEETFTFFLRSIAYLLVNRSSISSLLKRAQSRPADADKSFAACAVRTLTEISKQRPSLYKSHIAELIKVLSNEKDEKLVQVALHALSRLYMVEKGLTVDKKLSERAKHFARKDNPKQAKYATTILALDEARPGAADDIVEVLADDLNEATDSQLVSRLYALSRLARFARDSFEKKSEQITTSALEILTRASIEDEEANGMSWISDDQVSPLTLARELAVKVLTNRCLPYAGTDETKTVSGPVFQLLWPLLSNHDEDSAYTASTSSRLRLAAALSMLKLAALPSYESAISERFEQLARTAQDESFEARNTFVNKLLSYLRTGRIRSPRYNMVLFLVAHDPEDEIKAAVQHYVETRARRVPPASRQEQLEHPFVRLVHLLAHHPDFVGDDHDADEIAAMSKYIELYLDCLATQENVPYLYHLALKIKTVRDHDADYDTNLYMLSELAQHLIKQLAKSHNWAIPSHPVSVKMPSDCFRALPDKRRAEHVAKTVYLPAELLSKVSFKGTKPKTVKVKSAAAAANGTKRKSPQARTPRASKPRKRKSEGWDSESAESENQSDEDEDEDEDEDGEPSVKKQKKAQTVTNGTKSRPARRSTGGGGGGTDAADSSPNKRRTKATKENEKVHGSSPDKNEANGKKGGTVNGSAGKPKKGPRAPRQMTLKRYEIELMPGSDDGDDDKETAKSKMDED